MSGSVLGMVVVLKQVARCFDSWFFSIDMETVLERGGQRMYQIFLYTRKHILRVTYFTIHALEQCIVFAS